MPRTPTIGYEQFCRVASALLALNGHRLDDLTFARVYEQLGRRGSSQRINDFLKRFKDEYRSGERPGGLSGELEAEMRASAQRITETLQREAQAMIEAERASIQAPLDEARQEAEAAQTASAAVRQQYRDLEDTLQREQEVRAQVERRLSELQRQHDTLTNEHHAIAKESTRLESELSHHAEQLTQRNADNEALQEEVKELRTGRERLMAQVRDLERDLAEAFRETARLTATMKERDAVITQLETRVDHEHRRTAEANRQHQAEEQRRIASETREQCGKQQSEALIAKLEQKHAREIDEMRSALAAAASKRHETDRKMHQLIEYVERLSNQLAAAPKKTRAGKRSRRPPQSER